MSSVILNLKIILMRYQDAMLESSHKYVFRNERFLDYGVSENETSLIEM